MLAAATVAAAGACLDEDVTGVRTADIRIMVSPTTVVAGATVNLSFEAEGTGIARVVLAWGDGVADTTNFSGPIEVAGDRTHVYGAPGTYIVVGSVAATAGIAVDSVTVTVN